MMASSKDDLRVDDLLEVQEAIWDARPKWKYIGLGLKIRQPDIEVINVNNGNVDDKFQSMILKWLENGKNWTWGVLCEVLSLRSVGHDNLATEIKRQKCVDPVLFRTGMCHRKPMRGIRVCLQPSIVKQLVPKYPQAHLITHLMTIREGMEPKRLWAPITLL